jgi:protease II
MMLGVPFVNVLTTMLNETIPLTTIGKQLHSEAL